MMLCFLWPRSRTGCIQKPNYNLHAQAELWVGSYRTLGYSKALHVEKLECLSSVSEVLSCYVWCTYWRWRVFLHLCDWMFHGTFKFNWSRCDFKTFSFRCDQTHTTSSLHLSVLYNFLMKCVMCFSAPAAVIVSDLCEQVCISLDSQVWLLCEFCWAFRTCAMLRSQTDIFSALITGEIIVYSVFSFRC